MNICNIDVRFLRFCESRGNDLMRSGMVGTECKLYIQL